MSELIISVSGLRGIVGENLDPVLAIRYASAFIATLNNAGPIVVSRDGRSSGSMLASAINSAISASGFDVLYADVAATPTTGILVRQHKASGGIQISASHNPAPYNGMKLFGAEGRVITAKEGEAVLQNYNEPEDAWVSHEQLGNIGTLTDTTTTHLDSVLKTVDAPAIRKRRFKVVLDSNRGAGSILGEKLLESLGCEFEIIGDTPDGSFEHLPEPTEQNLQATIKRASEFGADVVFCQDPDADRLAILDENGVYIGEEYTLAITANQRLAKVAGPVVVNCSSSRMTADIAARHGCTFHVSAVGEANVTAKMIEEDAVYGGEGNGGPIDPEVGYVRDSFVAMAQVLDAMVGQGKTISDLVSEIPKYEICKTKISIERSQVPMLLNKLQEHFDSATANRMDGLRLDWKDSWLLVRPSNTEPIVRAIAEATSVERAQELCEAAANICKNL